MPYLVTIFRRIDQFGAQVRLNYRGDAQYKTLGGALATLVMYTLITFYLCISIKQVVSLTDPQISVYQIMENRESMKENLPFKDYHAEFVFGF